MTSQTSRIQLLSQTCESRLAVLSLVVPTVNPYLRAPSTPALPLTIPTMAISLQPTTTTHATSRPRTSPPNAAAQRLTTPAFPNPSASPTGTYKRKIAYFPRLPLSPQPQPRPAQHSVPRSNSQRSPTQPNALTDTTHTPLCASNPSPAEDRS